jgi:hypothetical protein
VTHDTRFRGYYPIWNSQTGVVQGLVVARDVQIGRIAPLYPAIPGIFCPRVGTGHLPERQRRQSEGQYSLGVTHLWSCVHVAPDVSGGHDGPMYAPTLKCLDTDYIDLLITSHKAFGCTEAAAVQPESTDTLAHDAFTRLLHRLEPDPETRRPLLDRSARCRNAIASAQRSLRARGDRTSIARVPGPFPRSNRVESGQIGWPPDSPWVESRTRGPACDNPVPQVGKSGGLGPRKE